MALHNSKDIMEEGRATDPRKDGTDNSHHRWCMRDNEAVVAAYALDCVRRWLVAVAWKLFSKMHVETLRS